ncbi:MAG: hypothetical protein AAF938_04260 [Myxococcota bacterium]
MPRWSPILALLFVGCATAVPVQISSTRLHHAMVRLQVRPSVEVMGVELDRNSRVRTPDGERWTLAELADGCASDPARHLASCRVQASPWFEIGRRRVRRRKAAKRFGMGALTVGAVVGAAAAVGALAEALGDEGPNPEFFPEQ